MSHVCDWQHTHTFMHCHSSGCACHAYALSGPGLLTYCAHLLACVPRAAIPPASHHQPPSVQLPSGAVALIEAGRSSAQAPPSGSGPQQPAAADAGTMPAQEQLTAAAVAPDADASADVHAADSAADADAGADAHAADSAALLDPAGAAASGEAGPGRAGAAGGALDHRSTVAGAEVVSGDMVGGKAVLHVVDRVLISPGLSRELGLLPSSGYHLLDTPQPTAATSGVQGLFAAGFAGWVLPTAVAMVLCLL